MSSLPAPMIDLVLFLLVLLGSIPPVEAQQQDNLPQCQPLTVWTYASMSACTSGDPPVARGVVQSDGTCRQTRVLEGNPSLLPGIYEAQCVPSSTPSETLEQGYLTFSHSGCTSDTCSLDDTGFGAPVCAQDWNTLSVYYARLGNPSLIPVMEFSPTTRRCLGFTVEGEVVLAFSVYGDCNCVPREQEVPSPPPRPPTPRPTRPPTRRPTRAPTTPQPTRLPTRRPTPTPTRAPVTLGPTPAPITSPPQSVPTTGEPTWRPTSRPTTVPPTTRPTVVPTKQPTTNVPTTTPTHVPTRRPTQFPTVSPTVWPTAGPTFTTQPTSSTVAPTSSTQTATLVPTTIAAVGTGRPIGLTEFTSAPAFTLAPAFVTSAPATANDDDDDERNVVDGVLTGDNNNNNNVNANDETSSVAVWASLTAGAGVLVCCVALCGLFACSRRKRKDETTTKNKKNHAKTHPLEFFQPTHDMDDDKNDYDGSPNTNTGALNEISFHQDEQDMSTLGDPVVGPTTYVPGYAASNESTATPFLFHNNHPEGDEGTVDSIYTSGTDLRVSKDDNSLEQFFSEGSLLHVEVPPGPLGLLIHTSDGRIRVNGIKPDSVFMEHGVQVGDYLVSVDNVDIQHLNSVALSALVQARANSSRLFSFERDVATEVEEEDDDFNELKPPQEEDEEKEENEASEEKDADTRENDLDVMIHC